MENPPAQVVGAAGVPGEDEIAGAGAEVCSWMLEGEELTCSIRAYWTDGAANTFS